MNTKTDELHYLDQIYKYMKHLEHIYKVGNMKDEEKARLIDISLKNVETQRSKILEEIGGNGLEEWRTFDQI
jgi:hypothetical protein